MNNTPKILFMILVLSLGTFAQGGTVTFSKSAAKAEAASSFGSSDFIFAHVKTSGPLAPMLTLNDRPVTLAVEYYVGGKMIEEEMFGFDPAKVKGSAASTFVIPVVSDPAGDVPLWGKNLFSTRLPAALSKLPAGTHEITFDFKSYNYKNPAESIAKGKFSLTIGPEAKAIYAKNEKESYDAMTKRGVTTVNASARDVAMGVVGGTNVITLVNNCGRSVWMRKALGSDKTEYRLAAGQTMKYDREGGYLEEWNFGTSKWTLVSKVWTADATGKANICTK